MSLREAETGPPQPPIRENAARREPLGIAGIDALLEGGLPEGNTLLVQGAPGTGKTILALQFLYEGAAQMGLPGLLLTFEEQPRRLYRDARALGWDFERLEHEQCLFVVYTSPAVFLREIEAGRYSEMVKQHGLRRVVVDSLTLFETLPQLLPEDATRVRFERIVNGLRRDDLTVLLTRELRTRDTPTAVTPEEYVADTIIQLEYRPVNERRVRQLEILKHRGSSHSPNRHPFVIGAGGLQIVPIPDGDAL
jgi:circadian clock protein KaiC